MIEKDLKHGDHIFVRGKGLLYSHHGMARGHFIIRRLERLYDKDLIRQEYDKLDL